MRRLTCVFTFGLLAYASRTASAQRILGGGVSGGGRNSRVEVAYVREARTIPDSLRLAAIVFWRGQPGWFYTHSEAESRRAAAITDSLTRASQRAGTIGGGNVARNAFAWIEYNWHSRRAAILGKSLVLPPGDSTLVILVDRIDGVGGPPSVQSFAINVPGYLDRRPHPATAAERREAFAAMIRSWSHVVDADARVREFVGPASAP